MKWVELSDVIRNKFKIEPLSVECGGTGAKTPGQARKNLEIATLNIDMGGMLDAFDTYEPDQYNNIFITTGDGMHIDSSIANNTLHLDIDTSAKDYVIEQGYSGGWHFRRWASGWAECVKTVNYGSIVVNNRWESGSLYYSNTYANIAEYPIVFTEAPRLFFNSRGSKTTIPLPDGYGTTTKPPHVYFYTGASSSTVIDLHLDIRAEGWWQ